MKRFTKQNKKGAFDCSGEKKEFKMRKTASFKVLRLSRDYLLDSGIMHLANNIIVVSFFAALSFCDLIDLINCPQGNNK